MMKLSVWLKQRLKSHRLVIMAQSGLKCRKLQSIDHDEIYGPDYYEMVDQTTGKSAKIMAETIVKHLQPETVIDMGCGAGNLIAELRELGVETKGLEFSQWGLKFCQKRELDVTRMDFTDPDLMSKSLGRFDLSISTEVVIQLPLQAAKNHIAYLCQHADTVLFSSPPCANDRRPQSPQTAEYWIQQFFNQGYELDHELSEEFRSRWENEGAAPWFYRRPMIFRKHAT